MDNENRLFESFDNLPPQEKNKKLTSDAVRTFNLYKAKLEDQEDKSYRDSEALERMVEKCREYDQLPEEVKNN